MRRLHNSSAMDARKIQNFDKIETNCRGSIDKVTSHASICGEAFWLAGNETVRFGGAECGR